MPRRKHEDAYAVAGEKDYWHSYSLQMLTPSKFSLVVGNILKGKYTLIISKLGKGATPRVN